MNVTTSHHTARARPARGGAKSCLILGQDGYLKLT